MCREGAGSEEVPVAARQRWTRELSVVRSVLQFPSIVCMLSRRGVAQHPPFGGYALAATGDGQQPHPTENSGHHNTVTEKCV